MDLLFLLFVAVTGLCIGSFAGALVYRIPRRMDVTGLKAGGSSCTSCGVRLEARDLIPVVSWVMARGRCRTCKNPVSLLYPALETLALILALGIGYVKGPSWETIPLILSIPFLLTIAVLDFRGERITSFISTIVFFLSVVYAVLVCVGAQSVPWANILAALFLFLFFWGANLLSARFSRKSIFKPFLAILGAACGLVLGMGEAASLLLCAALIGIFTIFLRKPRGEGRKEPAIALALTISFYLHVFLTGLGIE